MNSPFDQKQIDLLNELLKNLTTQQRIWLSGYLSATSVAESQVSQATPLQVETKAEVQKEINNKIVRVIVDRIQSKIKSLERSRILLVSRGSSDRRIVRNLNQLKENLKVSLRTNNIEVTYLLGQNPLFNERLERLAHKERETIFVMPFFLFTGKLVT